MTYSRKITGFMTVRALSVRQRLICLVLLAAAPMLVDRAMSVVERLEARMERAHELVVRIARRAAEDQHRYLVDARALLPVAAALPSLDSCDGAMAVSARIAPWLKDLWIADSEGRAICGTSVLLAGLSLGDRGYFREVIATRDFVTSDYVISRITGQPAVLVSYPRLASDGSVDRVLIASMRLDWFADALHDIEGIPNSLVLLFDGDNRLVGGSPGARPWIGESFGGDLIDGALTEPPQGLVESTRPDGLVRLSTWVQLAGTRSRLMVAIPREHVLSGLWRVAAWELGKPLVFVTIFILAAWFGGERLIVRPARIMARAAARIGAGNLEARALEDNLPPEFREVAHAFDDMAERLQIATARLEELAIRDGLTGLANRRHFDEQMERKWRRGSRHQSPLAVLMIDVDHFKDFNDRYGHLAGDDCLRGVGRVIADAVRRGSEIAARIGGEEFALLMPDTDLAGAYAVAESILRGVRGLHLEHQDGCGRVTVSIGVAAQVPESAQPPRMLIAAADRALYAAKREGRNRIICEEPQPHVAAA
jgi:diguanylate cyclase (GGDEF)-like protein